MGSVSWVLDSIQHNGQVSDIMLFMSKSLTGRLPQTLGNNFFWTTNQIYIRVPSIWKEENDVWLPIIYAVWKRWRWHSGGTDWSTDDEFHAHHLPCSVGAYSQGLALTQYPKSYKGSSMPRRLRPARRQLVGTHKAFTWTPGIFFRNHRTSTLSPPLTSNQHQNRASSQSPWLRMKRRVWKEELESRRYAQDVKHASTLRCSKPWLPLKLLHRGKRPYQAIHISSHHRSLATTN